MGRKARLKRRYFLLLDCEYTTNLDVAGQIGRQVRINKEFISEGFSKAVKLPLECEPFHLRNKEHGPWLMFEAEIKEFPRGFQPTPAIRKYFRKLRGNT